ncbi:hypothetical protein GBA63_03015 [Rubrobacter tropicus]|uniref:Uncharacterized protein n=1 Tax=Rubrobacter tropicus TaxID=2653851 RepID=A0A6G8Q5I7_9ACTN|nr:hypothetical protein [Rubrobacter tropicus]QIN81720.1 hypothetical protein GBA63_03015 [Rubrobacter tropicus]
MEQRPDRELEKRRTRHARRSSDADEFWDGIGVDVEGMSPRAQVITSLAVLIPVLLGAASVLFLFTNFWWLVFVFGWTVFPGFSLLLRGIAGLSDSEGRKEIPGGSKERELLSVLREHEEISPTRAAMETSLTVEEADNMLKELAAKGHLDVRVRGGGIFYGLWKGESDRELEEGR